jgi:hypothetical protein
MRPSRNLVKLSRLVLLASLAGCGGGATDDLPRQPVSGTVSLDGRPLARGYIQFQPLGEQGVAAGGDVTDGKYGIDLAQGPIPGEYKVIISSAGASGPSSAEPPPPPGAPTMPPPDPIPARYNTESTLTAKVEAGRPNKFDFSMTSK